MEWRCVLASFESVGRAREQQLIMVTSVGVVGTRPALIIALSTRLAWFRSALPRRRVHALHTGARGNIFRVGILLDFVKPPTRTHHA